MKKFAGVLMLGVVCLFTVQVYQTSQQQYRQTQHVMQIATEMLMPALAEALNEHQNATIEMLLAKLISWQEIGGAQVLMADGRYFSVGQSGHLGDESGYGLVTLNIPTGEADGVAGSIGVRLDQQVYQAQLSRSLFSLLLADVLTACALWLICALGFKQGAWPNLRTHIELNSEPSQRHDELVQQLITDELTGCYNRRLLTRSLPQELQRAERYQRNLALLFVDVDFFKQINDRYGHAIGDRALQDVVKRMQESLRKEIDRLIRYGGDEFLIMLPETSLKQAKHVAGRLKKLVAAQPFIYGQDKIGLTVSIGVVAYQFGESGEALLARADAMLYEAKQQGRNQIFGA